MDELLTLLLADGRAPTGGYAHSAGLEPLVRAGAQRAAAASSPAAAASPAVPDVPAFLRGRLRTVARVDAAFAVRAAVATSMDELLELELELAARTPSAATRTASAALGRALLRLGLRLWPDDAPLLDYAEGADAVARPIALGVVARAAGASPEAVARMAVYDDAATVVAAVPKLLRIDAADATAWLAACLPDVERAAAEAVECARAGVLPATSTPLLDLRAERHHTDRRRLFAS